MQKNDKILLGVGLGVLAFYLLSRKKKDSLLNIQENITSSDNLQNSTNTEAKPVSAIINLSSPNNTTNKLGYSNLTKQERDAIEVAKKLSNRNFTENDILSTSLGNFKYVLIRAGKRSGLTLGFPSIYDWVRTNEQPKNYQKDLGKLGSILANQK